MESKVSIIMPCYNSGKTIFKSVSSVLNQSYQNWELIIVDDNSTDSTFFSLQSLSEVDKRISIYQLPCNSGSPATPRNYGLDICDGDYIAFLDSDDEWLPKKLELQIQFMQDNNVSFSCTSYEIREGGEMKHIYRPPTKITYSDLLSNNSIGCLTCVISKGLISGYKFPLIGHEDYALWLKILRDKNVDVFSVGDVLAIYNRVENSVSSNKIKVCSYFFNIYRNQEGFGFFKSLFFCARYLFNVLLVKYK